MVPNRLSGFLRPKVPSCSIRSQNYPRTQIRVTDLRPSNRMNGVGIAPSAPTSSKGFHTRHCLLPGREGPSSLSTRGTSIPAERAESLPEVVTLPIKERTHALTPASSAFRRILPCFRPPSSSWRMLTLSRVHIKPGKMQHRAFKCELFIRIYCPFSGVSLFHTVPSCPPLGEKSLKSLQRASECEESSVKLMWHWQ